MRIAKLQRHCRFTSAAALSACLLLSACATTSQTPESANISQSKQYAGFISDYSKLKPVANDDNAESWLDPTVDFAGYDKVLIERIRVVLKNDEQAQAIDPTELKVLADYFHEALVREFGDTYPVVSEPGPGVLRMRIAITNLVPTKPEISVVALVVPYATIADFASGAAQGREAGSPAYVGDTGIEAEFLDSQTTRVVGQYVDDEVGKKYVVDTSKGIGEAIGTGVSQYSKAYTTWGYAKQAFDTWAKRFRERFDQLHRGS